MENLIINAGQTVISGINAKLVLVLAAIGTFVIAKRLSDGYVDRQVRKTQSK